MGPLMSFCQIWNCVQNPFVVLDLCLSLQVSHQNVFNMVSMLNTLTEDTVSSVLKILCPFLSGALGWTFPSTFQTHLVFWCKMTVWKVRQPVLHFPTEKTTPEKPLKCSKGFSKSSPGLSFFFWTTGSSLSATPGLVPFLAEEPKIEESISTMATFPTPWWVGVIIQTFSLIVWQWWSGDGPISWRVVFATLLSCQKIVKTVTDLWKTVQKKFLDFEATSW